MLRRWLLDPRRPLRLSRQVAANVVAANTRNSQRRQRRPRNAAPRRLARSAEPRHRHARHDARRSDRRLRRARCRDADHRSARQRRRAVRAGRLRRAADAPGALEHLHRKVPARARRARQRRVLSRPGAGRPWPRRSRPAAIAPAHSSRPTCSPRSGASTRDSTPTSTTSISARSRAVSLSAIQRPANEVLDKALPWIEEASAFTVLCVDPSLRPALAVPAA